MYICFTSDFTNSLVARAKYFEVWCNPPPNISEIVVSYAKWSECLKNACFQGGKCPIRCQNRHFLLLSIIIPLKYQIFLLGTSYTLIPYQHIHGLHFPTHNTIPEWNIKRFLLGQIRMSDLSGLVSPNNALKFTHLRQGLCNICYHAKKMHHRTNPFI